MGPVLHGYTPRIVPPPFYQLEHGPRETHLPCVCKPQPPPPEWRNHPACIVRRRVESCSCHPHRPNMYAPILPYCLFLPSPCYALPASPIYKVSAFAGRNPALAAYSYTIQKNTASSVTTTACS